MIPPLQQVIDEESQDWRWTLETIEWGGKWAAKLKRELIAQVEDERHYSVEEEIYYENRIERSRFLLKCNPRQVDMTRELMGEQEFIDEVHNEQMKGRVDEIFARYLSLPVPYGSSAAMRIRRVEWIKRFFGINCQQESMAKISDGVDLSYERVRQCIRSFMREVSEWVEYF